MMNIDCDVPTYKSVYNVNGNEQVISLMCLNVRSIKNKLDDLKVLIDEIGHPDVLCLTETWLYSSIEDQFHINGYNVVFLSRDGERGGGVAIYISEDLSYAEGRKIHNNYFILEVIIKAGPFSVNVICVYNPHIDNAMKLFDDLEMLYSLHYKSNLVIVGDFNINTLCKTEVTPTHIDLLEPC